MMKNNLIVCLIFATFAATTWASSKTVTLSVTRMTCAACPITVKKALTKVDGVDKININYVNREVIVTYDDAKVNVEILTEATKNAGYPSSAK